MTPEVFFKALRDRSQDVCSVIQITNQSLFRSLTLRESDMKPQKETASWLGWRGSRGLSRRNHLSYQERRHHKLPDVETQTPFP
jgi:hypothetical protein